MLAMVQTLIPVPDQAEYQSKLIVQQAANAEINTVQQQMIDILQAMQATQIETQTVVAAMVAIMGTIM